MSPGRRQPETGSQVNAAEQQGCCVGLAPPAVPLIPDNGDATMEAQTLILWKACAEKALPHQRVARALCAQNFNKEGINKSSSIFPHIHF